MSKIKFKICGMRDTQNILDVAALQPDFIGFIFYDKSKRYVGQDFVIPSNFPKSVHRVGVFVNENVNAILDKVTSHKLDFVQLHGDETADICSSLRTKVKVIKAFRIDEHFDFKSVEDFKDCVDYFLFDTKSDFYGGTGKTFDWTLLKNYRGKIPFFLSGGLSEKNIEKVSSLGFSQLFALDLNSGVETIPGFKNLNSINLIKKKLLLEN